MTLRNEVGFKANTDIDALLLERQLAMSFFSLSKSTQCIRLAIAELAHGYQSSKAHVETLVQLFSVTLTSSWVFGARTYNEENLSRVQMKAV